MRWSRSPQRLRWLRPALSLALSVVEGLVEVGVETNATQKKGLPQKTEEALTKPKR